ncbi:SapC family protein [Sphingomonas sp. SUN039]|uniref:SapC family protein n=1 Tax=Sphingomonas sp. SUN039 TaxID=2937787 RepID=UPI00216447E8|nr:SapC family protein [Sphingomonas sp. SUN039]UVO53073.1 SapC family protein [Sphingomonas sp. SUN039]
MSNHRILNSADHGDLRVHTGAGAQYGDNVMACLAPPAEFRQIQGHFPIVFRRDIETGAFGAVALFGFESGENLFLQGETWAASYRPMALAIQPFLIGRPAEGFDTPRVHVDTRHPRIAMGGDGMRVFDEDGRPSPYLELIAERLGNLDYAHRQSPAFFEALIRYDLIEPFTLEVPLNDGSRHSLVGYHTINEGRLAELDGEALGQLNAEGHLSPLFMAMASLSRFGELVARKNARIVGG